jgi:zinc/manganese transport system substrate-binding protein
MKKWVLGVIGAIVVGLLAAFVVGPVLFGPKPDSTSSANPSPSVTRDGATGVVKVLASTNVWGDIVKQLGGEWVDVQVIIDDPLQDPHSYEATARDQLAVNDAELVVLNGGGYDDFLNQLVNSADSEEPKFVIFAVDAEDSHGESDSAAHAHDHENEHVWYDFVSVMEFADKFLATMGELRPESFDDLNQNYDFFSSEVANLTVRMEALRDHSLGLGVIATEGVGNLLLEHAGFVNQTPEALADAIEEETEVPPAALAETESLIENGLISLLVTNSQVEDQVSARLIKLAEANSVPVVQLSELIPDPQMDYLDWMNQVLDQLQEAIY